MDSLNHYIKDSNLKPVELTLGPVQDDLTMESQFGQLLTPSDSPRVSLSNFVEYYDAKLFKFDLKTNAMLGLDGTLTFLFGDHEESVWNYTLYLGKEDRFKIESNEVSYTRDTLFEIIDSEEYDSAYLLVLLKKRENNTFRFKISLSNSLGSFTSKMIYYYIGIGAGSLLIVLAVCGLICSKKN